MDMYMQSNKVLGWTVKTTKCNVVKAIPIEIVYFRVSISGCQIWTLLVSHLIKSNPQPMLRLESSSVGNIVWKQYALHLHKK